MNAYLRPSIDARVFRDADGRVIEYGRRWPESPPEETYSVVTHPERFAPVHTVADALITHLCATYDVAVTDSTEVAGDLLHPAPGVTRAVRIRPNDAACASLTFVLTAHPGVLVHAGLLHDFRYPTCGCDACDSSWEAEADLLERQVLAVAAGHYRESVQPGLRPRVQYALTHPDGANSGGSLARDLPAERLRAARPVLSDLVDGWSAWPAGGDATSGPTERRPRE